MGCCYRLYEEQTASWPTARANCALLKSRENLSMSRRSQNLCRFVLFLETQWGVEGRMFPFFLSVYLPSLPLSPSSLFHRSLPLSQSCSLPSLTAFFAISFYAISPSLSILSLSPSPSVYFLLYSSSHIAWMPLSHPPPLRTHASWGILIGWSFKESSVGEWVAVWLEGVRQTARRLCSNAGAPSLSPRKFLKWASTLFLFPSHSNHSDSWECFTVVTSVLSNLSSCTPLPTCP